MYSGIYPQGELLVTAFADRIFIVYLSTAYYMAGILSRNGMVYFQVILEKDMICSFIQNLFNSWVTVAEPWGFEDDNVWSVPLV